MRTMQMQTMRRMSLLTFIASLSCLGLSVSCLGPAQARSLTKEQIRPPCGDEFNNRPADKPCVSSLDSHRHARSNDLLAVEFKPGIIRYGATVADMQKALAGLCKTINTRRIDPPFKILRDIKDKQMQIDCDGFEFQGKPRWAEFVFGDDSLEMVWIMTTAEEEGPLLKAMTSANGEPTRRNQQFIAFTNGRMALRLDQPEVLFYSERLAPRILPWFEQNPSAR